MNIVDRIQHAKLRSMIDDFLPSGSNKAVWDGANDHAQPVSSGIYFYRVCCSIQNFMGKMILAKR